MHIPAVVALALCALVGAAPTITYDQHQQGGMNIRADLQNLVFVAIVPKNEIAASSNVLMDIVSSLHRRQSHEHHHHDSAEIQDRADVGAIEAFIEPESTYKVDITGSKSEAEVQSEPEVVLIENKPPVQSAIKIIEVIEGDKKPSQVVEEVKSPSAGNQDVEHLPALIKDEVEEIKETDETEESEPKLKEATRDENVPETLILVGDSIEQCGPLRRRDQNGVCQFASDLQKSESSKEN